MAEQNWTIDTPDGKKIYGLINTSDKKKNNKTILYIHGLGGGFRDHPAVKMANTFPEKGYDIIRMNLYDWAEDARKLSDCTIKQHADDINQVIKYFKKTYKTIFAVGHSYGGPCLMSCKINQLSGVSLWDPSFIPQLSAPQNAFVKSGKYYIGFDLINVPVVVSKAFIDEAAQFNHTYAVQLSKKCKSPLQVIYSDSNSFWIEQGESFHTHSKGPTDQRTVKQSNHYFFEQGSTEPLLRYTRQWFDQF
jgi:dienelactone hydrolase